MMGYGSKTQLALKLALIDFQGGVVFIAHLGGLLGFLSLFTSLPK